MASAGSVVVDFSAQTAQFVAELKKVNSSLKNLEGGFAGVNKLARLATGAFSVGAVVAYAKSVFNAADAIGDAAARAGIAVDSLSRLKFAAEQSDVEFATLTTSIRKFQDTLSNAGRGDSSAVSALNAVRLSAEQLRGLKLEDQLARVADAFKQIRDPADRVRIATDLFGRSGAELIPLLVKGSAGIEELTAEADRLGITMSQSTADGIGAADEALKRLKATVQGFSTRMLGGLALAILGPSQDTLDAANATRDLDEAMRAAGGTAAELVRQKDLLLARSGGGQSPAFAQALEVINERIKEVAANLGMLQGPLTRGGRRGAAGPIGETVGEVTLDLAPEDQISEFQKRDQQAQAEMAVLHQQMLRERLSRETAYSLELYRIQQERVTFEQELQTAAIEGARIQSEQRVADVRDASLREVQERIAAEQYAADVQVQIRESLTNNLVGLLRVFAAKHKAAAIAIVIIQKANAIAQALALHGVAIAQAAASAPPPYNLPAIAAAKAFMVANLAMIGASGIAEIAQIRQAGGAPAGSNANPLITRNDAFGNDDERSSAGATSQNALTVQIHGNVFSSRETAEWLIDQIKEAVTDRDVVLINNNSRNWQDLKGDL